MSDILRRRTYLLSLLNMGEILACRYLDLNEDSGLGRTGYILPRSIDFNIEALLIIGWIDKTMYQALFIKASDYITCGSSDFEFHIRYYLEDNRIGITFSSSAGLSNYFQAFLAMAIPRTDV